MIHSRKGLKGDFSLPSFWNQSKNSFSVISAKVCCFPSGMKMSESGDQWCFWRVPVGCEERVPLIVVWKNIGSSKSWSR